MSWNKDQILRLMGMDLTDEVQYYYNLKLDTGDLEKLKNIACKYEECKFEMPRWITICVKKFLEDYEGTRRIK